MSRDLILLIARVLLSLMFIMSGLQKLGAIEGTAGYIASVGLPTPSLLAWGAAAFEIVAGIAILLGFLTRYAAWALAAFCVFAAVIFHLQPTDQIQMIMFMKNLTIAGGFLVLTIIGAGSLSIDARRS